MTNAEYEKLVSTYGKSFADRCIFVLDNYKGSSGKTYKDDYRAILSWVVDKVKKENNSTQKVKFGDYEQRNYDESTFKGLYVVGGDST